MERPERDQLDAAMARLAKGDRDAFPGVFRTMWPVLARACSRWLDDPAEGEDAAQKVIIELMSRAHTYEEDESAIAWALTIAMWECRSVRRRRFRSRLEPLAAAPDRASAEPSPEALVADQEIARGVLGLMGQLSEGDQELIREMVSEASGHEGPVPASARKRKQRAIERLRDLARRFYGA